jgi:GTPase SAR1 family protein
MPEPNFINAFAQTLQQRTEVADRLQQMADIIRTAEAAGESTSGQLGLTRDLQALDLASQQLREGVFRLIVIGDMKRGKSTLINALLGESILPSDVNPCTALLTVVKYGAEKQVTVHFNTERSPETLDIESFKTTYSISPEDAKDLEAQQAIAFPEVSHAVIEYPSPLLQQGIEIVDTPGLNDTEARNQTVLDYLGTCHAVLFVLSATQPCTLDERRYLQNYLKDRGLALFFLINGWDRLASSLVDPEDKAALQAAQDKVRQVFQTQLSEYIAEGSYGDRVFELSALNGLKGRRQDNFNLVAASGLIEFEETLRVFLTLERFGIQLKWVERLVQTVVGHIRVSVGRRIPLLEDTVAELRTKLESIQEEFDQLAMIRDQFLVLIRQASNRQAKEISTSFQSYILGLEATFETDFVQSQPDLSFTEFLNPNNRKAAYSAFKRAFERYINDRLAAWEFMTKQSLGKAFEDLNQKAEEYSISYEQIVDTMNRKLLGTRFEAFDKRYPQQQFATWSDRVQDLFAAIPDTLNNTASQFSLFWQRVFQGALAYIVVVVALQILGIIFSGLAFNVFAILLGGLGVLAAQAEVVRQTFLETTKREFAKYLPQIATEQQPVVAKAVHSCFEAYEASVAERINTDIAARRAEMVNLLHQKETHDIQKDQEILRLQQLETTVVELGQQVTAEFIA